MIPIVSDSFGWHFGFYVLLLLACVGCLVLSIPRNFLILAQESHFTILECG